MAEGTSVIEAGLWFCVACGCTDVEEVAWVLMNSGEISSARAPVTHWCPECQSHDIDIDFASGGQLGVAIPTDSGERRLHSFDGEDVADRELP
jgi:hypothetical protein